MFLDRSALHHISYVLRALVESVYDHALEPQPAPYSIAERWPPIRAANKQLIPAAGITKVGFGWLNIRIIRIRICLKCKYGYPYSYSILIWMSYGCI